PFDPATKMSEATVAQPGGGTERVVKGAYAAIITLAQPSPDASAAANELEGQGFRVLAVAAGPPAALKLAGLIALSDPPRADSAALISELKGLGVRTVMVTGDAPATAAIVAKAVGLDGVICPPGPIPDDVHPEQFAVLGLNDISVLSKSCHGRSLSRDKAVILRIVGQSVALGSLTGGRSPR